MLWKLIYHMSLIAVHSVCAVGFFMFFWKERKPLHLWVALVFCCCLLDDGLVLTGEVIPALLYERVTGAVNSPAITVIKELISICIFYFMRRISAQVCEDRVTKWENVAWCVLGCIIIVDKCLPNSGSFPALMVIFLIYTAESMFISIRALIMLYRRRSTISTADYGFWTCIFLLAVVCYVLGGIINIMMMRGQPVQNLFGDALWLGYSVAAVVQLIRRLMRANETDQQLVLLEMRRRYGITDREAEVLHLLAEGKSNAELCAELHIALGTAKTHTYNIYRKLGVNNRTQLQALVAEAARNAGNSFNI